MPCPNFIVSCCGWLPQRYLMAFFGFTAIINAYTMRSCLTMTMLRMVGEHSDPVCNLSALVYQFIMALIRGGYLLLLIATVG